jgi:propanol-preferring alcohol dehydrogenase
MDSKEKRMAESMRAAVVTGFGAPLEVQDVEIPTPGYGEVLIKTIYSGVCHTDLHAAHGDWPVKPTPPFIPGHEGVGEVVAVGEGVTSLKVGDLAGNAWLWSACGECEWCETGRETLCPKAQYGGYTKNGSFGQYMLEDAKYAPRIPRSLEGRLAELAPILCAGVTVYKGLKVSEVRPGEWVLISGIGGLGHIAVQYAVAMGMRVVAVDVDDAKSALAIKHGAEFAFNAITEGDGLTAKIKEVTGGGVHGGLVTAVNGKAFPLAVASLRSGGTLSLVGLPPESFPLDIFSTVLFGLTIRGSLVGTRKDMEEAIDFFARGLIHPTYKVQQLDEINDIFHEMEEGHIDGRIVMDMGHA